MKKILLFAFVALVAMTGCEKKQSEFTIDSLGGNATLTGSVFYAPGYKIDSKGSDEQLEALPAANQKLLVVVPNSSYLSGASGNKTYETTIAKDGSFSITIPVPATKNLSGYDFDIRPFKAEYNAIVYNYEVYPYTKFEEKKTAYIDYISGLSTPSLKNGNTYYVGKVTLTYSKLIDINKK